LQPRYGLAVPGAAEVVVPVVPFPEGPVWCDDGTLVFTSVPNGALYRVDVDSGVVSTIAVVGGGANSAAPASDGGFVVTQNGGIDFTGIPGIDPSTMPPFAPITPGIQHVAPDHTVRYLFDDGFLAPNDLSATADGTLYFTDPPHHPPPAEPAGRVHVVDADGCRVFADGFLYPNGIAVEPSGTLVLVEARGLLRLHADASREWIVEHLGDNAGDGMCLDVDGRIYACCTRDDAVRVFEPDGTEIDRLDLSGDGLATNCCFGGADLRTLFVTEGIPGRVVAFEGMPTAGLPVHRVPIP
jgi:gluconolactonase